MKTIFGRTEENWYLPELKQDTLVEFDMGTGFKGTGKVVGIATNGSAVIGTSYIIEIGENVIIPDVYNYTHFVCAEIFLNPIDLDKLYPMGSIEGDVKTNDDIDIDEKYTTGHRI